MKQFAIYDRVSTFFLRYGKLLFSILFALLGCEFEYGGDAGVEIDGSWMRLMYEAFKHSWVFGNDIVFTYGPLAILETHFCAPSIKWLVVTGQFSLFAGYFWLLYKYMPWERWWPLLLLGATITLRYAHFSQVAFLLFLFYCCVLLLKKADRFSVLLCALYAAVVFFVKVNYGILILAIAPATGLLLALQRKRHAALFLALFFTFFSAIYLSISIDLIGYVKNSSAIILNYEEAMFLPAHPGKMPYKHTMYLFAFTGAFLIYALYQVIKNKRDVAGHVFLTLICALFCFLSFKNAFTRCDHPHNRQVFATYPILFLFMCTITGYYHKAVVKLLCAAVFLLSIWAMPGENAKISNLSFDDIKRHIWPYTYYQQMFTTPSQVDYPEAAFDKEKLGLLKGKTIDIFPHEVGYLLVNDLNYRPRPIPQSYTAYSRTLDSLNAAHFTSEARPELVLFRHEGIDERYGAWDESVTKMTLHLNYKVVDSIAAGRETKRMYLLLKANTGTPTLPKLKHVSATTVRIGDTVWIKETTSQPLYLTADVQYTTIGALNKLLFQPMRIGITLITDSAAKEYRLIIPIMKQPVLINYFIENDRDMLHFLNGEITANKKLRAFVINTHNQEIKRDVQLNYYIFDNY